MLRKRLVASSLLIMYLLVTSCAAVVVGAAAGGGAIVWQRGKLVDQISATVPNTFEATRDGLKDLRLPILEQRFDSIRGNVKSELADGKKVFIKLKATEGGTTEISIRVGYGLGEKDASYMILNSIKKRL